MSIISNWVEEAVNYLESRQTCFLKTQSDVCIFWRQREHFEKLLISFGLNVGSFGSFKYSYILNLYNSIEYKVRQEHDLATLVAGAFKIPNRCSKTS